MISKKKEEFENLCTKSMESCSLVISQILAEFRPERATYKALQINKFSSKWIIQICSNLDCCFYKIASTHPIHSCLGGNSEKKISRVIKIKGNILREFIRAQISALEMCRSGNPLF